jgi:hypothetical protein
MPTVPQASGFEEVMREGLSIPVGTAARASRTARKPPKRVRASEDAARELLADAFRRLDENPGLRRLAPDGAIAYSDPVLSVAAMWCSVAEQVGAAAAGDDLKKSSMWKWAIVGIQAWLNRSDKGLKELAARTPKRSRRIDKESARIAVVGDAGYSGVAQQRVIFSIREIHERKPFDLVVHLGDIYFSAGEAEVLRHLLVPFSYIDAPLVTLCGNHDLYHGPNGYLAALKLLKQEGRYFLIETPHWRIAALDTSLGAARILRDDGQLDKAQLDWLDEILLADSERPLILMSHHFMISGWDAPSEPLRAQLAQRVSNRVFAWYWGHEHRCACYDRGTWGFHGASVGNGAFLEPWSAPTRPRIIPLWYGKTTRCSCAGIRPNTYFPHGFLELELAPHLLKETYYLEGTKSHSRDLPP